MATIIQIRRDTAANWTTVNPILAEGEIGLETDTNKIKIGDGTSTWSSLSYFTASNVASVNGQTGVIILTAADVGALPDSTIIPSDTGDLTNGAGFITSSDIPVTDVQVDGTSVVIRGVASISTSKEIITLATSGTISPATNTHNYVAPTGAITLSLPTPSDTTIVNEIELQVNQTSTVGFDFGTVLWGEEGTPDMSVGIWDFIFTYIGGNWCTSYKKWESL